MLDAIADLVGVAVEWLLSKLPPGCLIFAGVMLAVAIVVGIAWAVAT